MKRGGGVLTFFPALLLLSFVMPLGNLYPQDGAEPGLPSRPERVSAGFSQRVAGFSAGVFLGQPISLSAKYSWKQRFALQGAFGYSLLGSSTGVTLQSSLIYHMDGARLTNGNYLRPFIGLGAALFVLKELEIALRLPLGLCFYLDSLPLEISVEGATGIMLVPDVKAYVSGGVALRYRFTSSVSSSSLEEQEKR